MNKLNHTTLHTTPPVRQAGFIKVWRRTKSIIPKPVNLLIAGVALSSLLSFQEAQTQQYNPQGDTLWGTGIFLIKNIETNAPVNDVLLSLTPESMAMITPDTTYTFITEDGGGAPFTLPVYIDSTTGIKDLLNDNTQVIPTVGSELNAFFPSIQKGTIEVYNLSGQLEKKQDFNTDNEYVQCNDMPAGIYIYNIRTQDGVELGGKFVKQNVPLKGPASRPSNTINTTVKGVQFYEATYWAKWEHPDFYTDSTLITLEDKNNGPIIFQMTSNIIPVPPHQDLTGTAQKTTSEGYGPLANMTAILYNQTLNETTQVTTNSDGEFVFQDVPTGSVCFISVGGNSSRYSLNNIEYTVPNTIEEFSDTIAPFFSTIHPNKLATTSASHIVGQTSDGTLSQTRYYWFDSGVPPSEQTQYNNQIAQLDAMGNGYTHVQTMDENEAHIKIYDGNYSTTTNSNVQFVTPLRTYTPTTIAHMSINPGDLGNIGHELYQADGKDQVGWYSILGPSPPSTGPTQEDLDIAELEMNYWVYGVYTDQKTYVNLNLLAEDLQTKAPQYKGQVYRNGEWIIREMK